MPLGPVLSLFWRYVGCMLGTFWLYMADLVATLGAYVRSMSAAEPVLQLIKNNVVQPGT